jgi:hypothetical protein
MGRKKAEPTDLRLSFAPFPDSQRHGVLNLTFCDHVHRSQVELKPLICLSTLAWHKHCTYNRQPSCEYYQ